MGSNIRAGAIVGGRYRIVRELASGSQATVYAAEQLDLGKQVAIKFLTWRASARADVIARFRRETRAIAATASDHTVQVFDVGEDPRFGLYMVMELLEGQSLGDRLAGGGRLNVDEAVVLGVQTSWALAKAHEAGVIHRDLKPDNLFLVEREAPALCVKLLDFGVAKLHRGLSSSITPCGITLGTPQYMSPEQVRAAQDIDPRTDIWSLGAVLFEALAGKPAIRDCDDMTEFFGRICNEGAPPLRSVAPHVPHAVTAVVDHALARDRDARIPDARTLAQRLLDAAPDSVAAVFMPQSTRLRAAVAHRFSAHHTVDFSSMDFDDTRTEPGSVARTAAQHAGAGIGPGIKAAAPRGPSVGSAASGAPATQPSGAAGGADASGGPSAPAGAPRKASFWSRAAAALGVA